MTVWANAQAKINLSLDVLGKLPNGYHEVEMVMQTISLADQLTVTPATETTLTGNCPALPLDASNLVWRAWRLLQEAYQLPNGVAIELTKQIPLAAGLAGGSADAAATLLAVNELYQLQKPLAELQQLALSLGADVPFCLQGGTALAQGIGERLTALPSCPALAVLVVNPGFPVNTAAVYRNLEFNKIKQRPDTEGLLSGIRQQNTAQVLASVGNVLETSAFDLFPELAGIKEQVAALGLRGLMSGSGGTILGLTADAEKAQFATAKLQEIYPFVELASTC